MNYASINKTDIANGPGVRVSLFVSGCRRHCQGCFNPQAWDFQYGIPFTQAAEQELLQALSPGYIAGLSILGGEPAEPENYAEVSRLCRLVKETYPEKSIWVYTGFRYEDLEESVAMRYIDVLVDGQFVESQKDLTLSFRGSKNQRLIDAQKTRRLGSVQLFQQEEVM